MPLDLTLDHLDPEAAMKLNPRQISAGSSISLKATLPRSSQLSGWI